MHLFSHLPETTFVKKDSPSKSFPGEAHHKLEQLVKGFSVLANQIKFTCSIYYAASVFLSL